MINIWCYWGQGIDKIPPFETKCLNNWERKLSKDIYKINVIDKDIFLQEQNDFTIKEFTSFTFQQQSDIVRLFYLYKYGGIWIDISSILITDFFWVLDKFNKGFEQVGFYVNYVFKPKTKYLLENWFIAVKNPKYYLIEKWKETFYKILKQSIQNGGINKSKIWQDTNKIYVGVNDEYLSMHIANLWCVQNDSKYKELYDKELYLYFANETALVCPLLDSKRFIFGLGYDYNFYFIKITKLNKSHIKYFTNKKLKKILDKEIPNNNIQSLYVHKIIFFILVVFYFLKKIL